LQTDLDAQLFFAEARAWFSESDQIGQLDPVEFAPDIG
jgi:hypothetical protein